MAKTRASSRRPKSALDRDRYTAELSTMQLVIGVCILLMFGLGCFLLGVLIGKFDPSLRDQMAEVTPQSSPAIPPPSNSVPPATNRPPARPVESALPPEIRPPQNLVEQPPSTDLTPDATTPAASPPNTQPSASTTDGAKTQEGTPATAAPEPVTPEPATQPPATERPTPPPVQAAPAAVQTSAQGIYGVQIIAVARPRAESVKRDIEAKSSYKAEIISIDADRLCKVVVGRFQDERSALVARDELRSKYEFRDAYVISLR